MLSSIGYSLFFKKPKHQMFLYDKPKGADVATHSFARRTAKVRNVDSGSTCRFQNKFRSYVEEFQRRRDGVRFTIMGSYVYYRRQYVFLMV